MSPIPPRAAIDAIARRLVRYFVGPDGDRAAAFTTALDALAAYEPVTLNDYLAASRLIALSFATLIATDRAADPDTSEKQQLRYLAKANTLGRTAQQTDAAIAKSRAQAAAPPPPALRYPTEEEVEEGFRELMAEVRASPHMRPADPRGHAFWDALEQCAAITPAPHRPMPHLAGTQAGGAQAGIAHPASASLPRRADAAGDGWPARTSATANRTMAGTGPGNDTARNDTAHNNTVTSRPAGT